MAKLSLDVKKCKAGGLAGLQLHDQRESDHHSNKDIDPARSHLNYDLHNDKKINFTKAIGNRIKEAGVEKKRAIRSDANVMISVVVQQNKEFFDELGPKRTKDYFKAAYDIFCEKYGKENIIAANVHLDEKAPHLHLKFVPIQDGKLIGGKLTNRPHLIELHTVVAQKLRERGFDVQRGEAEQEKREHLSPEKYKLQQLETRIENAKAMAVNEKEVREIHTRSKVKDPFWGSEHVELSIADYNKLTQTATAGAKAMADIGLLRDAAAKEGSFQKQIAVLNAQNRSLRAENKSMAGKVGKLDKQVSRAAIKLFKGYIESGLDNKTAAATLIKVDGFGENATAKAVATSPAAPSRSDEAAKWAKHIVSQALKSKDVAMAANLGDDDDVDWEALTPEQAKQKAAALEEKENSISIRF